MLPRQWKTRSIRLGESSQALSSNSRGWSGVQILQSHLVDRLVRFARTKTVHSRPHKIHNDAAFFEVDLHHILRKRTLLSCLSEEDFFDLERKARSLLGCLNELVNEDVINDRILASEESDVNQDPTYGVIYGIDMLSVEYPRLARLINVLDESSGQFTLISTDGMSLFRQPYGESGRQAIRQVAEWKSLLDRLEADTEKPLGFHSPYRSSTSSTIAKPTQQDDILQKRASVVVDKIFREFQRLPCHGEHEVKLKLCEKWYTKSPPAAVEMFMSCCRSSGSWHEAQCGRFEFDTNPEREEDVCRAIENARKRSTKLYLLVDERGLFNVTDHLPPVVTPIQDYRSETLDSLLQHKVFCRLSPQNYWDGTAVARFDAREKAALALVLSRCLMDFFDEEVELASYTWNPENIFFLGTHPADSKAQPIYVSLKPSPSGFKSLDFCKTVRPGNPILLSFAKLLLEIHCGERIPLEVHPQSTVNIPAWGRMCDFLLEKQMEEAGHYLEAVEGCLNLHKYLLRYRNGSTKMTDREMRKVIYEQVVSNLEVALNPSRSKRKRSGSISELPLPKKTSSMDSIGTELSGLDGPEQVGNGTKFRNGHNSVSTPGIDSTKLIDSSAVRHGSFPNTDRRVRHPSCSLNGTLSRATTIRGSYASVEDFDPELASAHQLNEGDDFSQPQNNRLHSVTQVKNSRRDWSHSVPPSMEQNQTLFSKYTVAIVCAIEFEMSAFRYMLDAEHPSLPRKEGDSNIYILGELRHHNIVLACLPGSQGKGAAATVVTHLARTFPSIEWRFMVGIGGGVPSAKHDIRLGDVVVSMPEGRHGGVVQYDLGKDTDGKFDLKGFLTPPPSLLRSAVLKMRSDHRLRDNMVLENLAAMLKRGKRLLVYQKPPEDTDVLFRTDYSHDTKNFTCEDCDSQRAVQRTARQFGGPEIHYGLIASGDRVIRSAANRNEIIREVGDILCFEMEAAGLATEHSCIVIRGISDYSDSHKNDEWQHYSAATAAACAKELLLYID